MQVYIARRLLLTVPVLFTVAVLTFVLLRLVPGDVTLTRIAEGGIYSPEQLQAMRKELGLTDPLHVQFIRWAGHLARGDFGRSLQTQRDTLATFVRAARITLELGLLAILLGLLIAVPVGILSAVRQDTPADYVGRLIATAGISVPDFWLGTMTVIFLGLWFHYQAPLGYRSPFTEPWANAQQFFFPALILGFRSSAVTMRLLRTTMLEVLRQDYIRTARAKGLNSRATIGRHALKNALIPVVTVVGTQLSFILGGTVIMESLFNLPGVGQLTFSAILQRDYTQVQTNMLLLGTTVVLGNLLTDLSYAWLDPRIRYR
jgi:peptide/nickel transport system permease protein